MSNASHRPDAVEARRQRGPTCIGDWVLYPDLGLLRCDSAEVRLNAKTLHVLLVLLDAGDQGDQGVSRDALLDKVWGTSYPSDNVVSRAVADLRSAFGEKAGEQRYIRTLPKFGYQLLAKQSPADRGDEATPGNTSRIMHSTTVWVASAVLAVIVVVTAVLYLENPASESIGQVIRLPPSRPLTTAPGIEHQPRLSADGKWVVYAALRPGRSDWDLFRVSTVDGVSQPVAVTPDVHEHGPAISPLGDEVAYVRLTTDDCNVVIQSITLGVPEPIVACTIRFPTLVDWSRDGNWIAYTSAIGDDDDDRRRIYAVHRFSGERRKLTDAVSLTGSDFYPRYSPSGKSLAFLRGEPQPDHRSTMWLVDVESGIETRLTHLPAQVGGMTWIDDSTLMYSIADAGNFEGRWLALDNGAEYPVDRPGLIHADFSASNNSLVATELQNDLELLLRRADGSTSTVASSTSDDHDGSLSPDESLIALISRRSGFDELWLAETDGEVARQLTRFDGATVRYPNWHPDGRRILFTGQTDEGERLYEVDIVSGAVSTVGEDGIEATTPRWMPDGRRWAYGCRDENGWGVCIGDANGNHRIDGEFYRPIPLDDKSLAVVDSAGVLHRIETETGASGVLWRGLPTDGRFGWTIVGRQLVYVNGGEESNLGRIIRRNLDSGEESILYEGPMPLADVALSLGRQSGAILFTTYQSSSDDVVLFLNVTGRD